ncbi:MAG: hypothetical protein J5I94_05060 [Phaeodactylibacter sp.]|nr:hypothetical protein [Phaeodactylibacter sp.]
MDETYNILVVILGVGFIGFRDAPDSPGSAGRGVPAAWPGRQLIHYVYYTGQAAMFMLENSGLASAEKWKASP